MTVARPALADTLSVVLPAPEQTTLLRACLHSGEAGRQAWQAWHAQVGDPRRALGRDTGVLKALLPLLSAAARRNGLAVAPPFLTVLRAAQVREELRSETFRRGRREALLALAEAGLPAILLKGAALAETVYEHPALRHSHDVDLLVRQANLPAAAAALPLAGFSPLDGGHGPSGTDPAFEHVSGLPLQLHSRPFQVPPANALAPEFWARSRAETIAGVATRILSPADSLVHVCGHAATCASRASLRWVCDAWHILHQWSDLDWDVVLDTARRGHFALPLYVTLGYLATELQAPVPPAALARLADAARRAGATGREAALYGARQDAGVTLRELFRRSERWASRALLARWLLLPSAGYLRWVEPPRHRRLLPLLYLYRPLRYGVRRVQWWREARWMRTQLRQGAGPG